MGIKTLLDFNNFLNDNPSALFYLSTPDCNVCKVLKPKVIGMLEKNFSHIQFKYIDLTEAKEISGQLSVFSVPTILIYFEGKETIRVSRNIHLDELREQIVRYYEILYS